MRADLQQFLERPCARQPCIQLLWARRSLAAQLLVINQMVDAAVALRPSGYDELLRRDAHYQESAELQR